jgi:DNA polymerase elongation subunit (family B)
MYMLSFSYKWEGGKTEVRGLPDYASFKKDKTNDKEMVAELWKVMDEADIIIGHNIDRFDIRKINSRFLLHGLGLPSTYKTVDTLKVARKMFMLNSNKLNFLANYLGLGSKVDTGGFQLWLDCMAGDSRAWKLMKKYNKQDVDLTQAVYKKLRPFITNHANINVLQGTTHNCNSCGSSHVQKRGWMITKTGKYQRYQCQECASWSTGERIKTDKVVLK